MSAERPQQTLELRQRIAMAAGAALLVAGLILVAVILPAEYGVDPLGTGARLGLVELGITGQRVEALETAAAAGTGQGAIVAPQDQRFNQETVEFTIAPGEGMEYKYRLDQGESLLYSWTSTGQTAFEFHAEPDGAPQGYAQTYEMARATQAAGTLTAPFTGIHGWYWENVGSEAITVTLTTAGFYNLSHEFLPGQPVRNKTFQ